MAVRTKKGIRRQVLHRFFHEIFILTLYFHNASHTSWLPFVSCPYILIIDFVRYFQGLTSYDGVCLRVLCVISHFYSLVCDWTAENECAAVELLSGAFIIPGLLYRCLIIQRLCLWLNSLFFFFSLYLLLLLSPADSVVDKIKSSSHFSLYHCTQNAFQVNLLKLSPGLPINLCNPTETIAFQGRHMVCKGLLSTSGD